MEKGPIILVWFLILAGAAMLIMLGVALSTRLEPLQQSDVTRQGYAMRRVWLWVLSATVIASFVLTVPSFPYPTASQSRSLRHFAVVAQQFSFRLPSTIPLNTDVIFDVTSKDVNHGFGIYDPNGQLIAQVQAMPDYTNHLPVRFRVPGTYTIRCLEYCGIAHHVMQASFEVR
jgi:cytochrome c oxidase subunit II